jgi:hypothetical protein
VGNTRAGRSVSLHSDCIDDGVWPATTGHLADQSCEVVSAAEVDHVNALCAHSVKALGHKVDADDAIATVLRYPAGHVADRSQAKDDD